MQNSDIGKIIDEYRGKRIKGKCIDLVPFTPDDAENVVGIRNEKKNRYFLNQTYNLTVEGQKKWYETYLRRNNDIYWCIYNKNGEFIGTVRVYEIDADKDLCDQGSFMIDEEHAEEAPYALETEILSLDFIFNVLKINQVINEDRSDNKVMNNLSKKLGFEFKKNTVINNIDYNYYILTPEAYKRNREKFTDIIDYFENRN